MNDQPHPVGPAPTIRLREHDNRLLVLAQSRAVGGRAQPEPFPLPRLPLTIVHWCSTLANGVRQAHGRSLAVALMLDCERRTWATPVVPTQVCRPRVASWTLEATDYSHLDRAIRVAGTYQAVSGHKDVFRLSQLVPPLDGIHLIEDYGSRRIRKSLIFVRRAGEVALADPAATVVNDIEAVLGQYRARLTFR